MLCIIAIMYIKKIVEWQLHTKILINLLNLFLFVIVYIEIKINHFIQISRLGLRKNYICRKKLDSILIIDATSGGF